MGECDSVLFSEYVGKEAEKGITWPQCYFKNYKFSGVRKPLGKVNLMSFDLLTLFPLYFQNILVTTGGE